MRDEAWDGVEYAGWLETVVKEMVEVDPESIALEMIARDGRLYTCYFNTSPDDRARMISAMQDDDRMEWVRNNREAILEILNGGEEDEEEGEITWTTID